MIIIINQTVAICDNTPEPVALAFFNEIHQLRIDHIAAGSPKSGSLKHDQN